MTPSIAILLPPREAHSERYRGAVALCMADFTRFSRYRERTVIYCGEQAHFEDLAHVQLRQWKRWYLRDNLAWARAFARECRTRGHTHVEVQNRPMMLHYLRWMLPEHMQLSLHLHNDPQTMHGSTSVRERQRLLERAAAVYCVSDYVRERFVEGLDRDTDKVHVVHNGIDTVAFVPQAKQQVIVYVGRMIWQKGALPLLEAFHGIAAQLPEWKLVLCGADRPEQTSEYERATHEIISRIGSQCVYTGYVDHAAVMQQFAGAAIAAVPSVWQEPFGRTALEALCAGAALVTSASGGIREVIDSDSALVIAPDQPASIAAALLRLANDAGLRSRLQQAGRQRAVEHFDIRSVASRLDDLRDALST